MTKIIDEKYIRQIAGSLERFANKGNGLYNFRCPFCGDSKKNKRKARGYLIPGKPGEGYFYKCHNCPEGGSFKNFLKKLYPAVFDEYNLEIYMDKHGIANTVSSTDTHFLSSSKEIRPHIEQVPMEKVDQHSIKLLDMSPMHFARRYISGRKIPVDFQQDLYYTQNFKEFVTNAFPEDAHEMPEDDRIIIPFYDEAGELMGITGRALKESKTWPKYIVVKARTEGFNKLFGLDKIKRGKRIYVTEGPIDSMFLDNGVALQDSALFKIRSMLPNHLCDAEITIVPDNQPRNKYVNASIKKCIEAGLDVCVWPKFLKGSDVNKMILDDDLTTSELMANIDDHTYNGMMAEFEFGRWRIE